MAHRVHNFNPGPAALPLVALERAREELLDYAGTGMSIMEHSHRGATYEAVHDETPLGPRDQETTGEHSFFDAEDDRAGFRDVFRRRR